MAFLVANSYMGLILEATRGTTPATGTPSFIPLTGPQVAPMLKFLNDDAFRGSPVLTYDQVQGVRHDEFDYKTYLYADTFPNHIRGILGGPDTVTGATSFTHVIKLLNAPATGSQPPSYSLVNFDGANWFLIAGAQESDVTVTFGAEVAAEGAVKWIGNPYTSSTAAPTPFTSLSLSSEHMIPAWDTVISIGGTPLNYIMSGELKLDRKTAPIFTAGQQGPHVNFAGPLEVTGKFTAVVDSTADAWSTTTSATALTRSPQTVVIALTSPNDITSAVNHSLTFTMTSVQFHDVKRTQGKEYTELDVNFTASANATDAATGFSPVSFTAINAVSSAY